MRIHLLGPLLVHADGVDVPVGGARARTLLTALAVHRGEVVRTERLIDLVWGDAPPAEPSNAVQAQVARLRRALRAADWGEPLRTVTGGYLLDLAPGDVDATVLERAVAEARNAPPDDAAPRLAAALELVRGPSLVELAHLPAFRPEAVRLDELVLLARQRRLEAALALGHAGEVVAELRPLVDDHPLREGLHALLLRALYAAGRQSEALDHYHVVRRRLADELGVDPSPELRAAHRDVLTHAVTVPARTAPSRVPSPAPLPRPLTRFIGREAEVALVRRRLADHRVVTLLGPGGAGKTRLALEVAAGSPSAFPGGVHLVELAGLSDPAAVPAAVATGIGIVPRLGTTGGPDLRPAAVRLRDHIGDRRVLIVLDNCEHLVDAAATAAEQLVRAGPAVHVLVTSREGLRIGGEALVPVPPLATPAEGSTRADLEQVESVRLFVDRATVVDPEFVLDDATAPAVAEVCRRLDGLPLALELAAARTSSLPIGVLADRLSDRFALLTGGSRTATRRQRTLEAVVEWSYDLLEPLEQVVFRRLGVFASSARGEAVEAVCGGDGVATEAVIPAVGALVDKSLASTATDQDGTLLVGTLETLRAFALQRLVRSGEADTVRDRHATHLAAVARRARDGVHGPGQLAWLARLERAHDDLRAALGWWVERRPDDAAELACDLAWFWWLHDHRSDAVRWLTALGAQALDDRRAARVEAWLAFHLAFEGAPAEELGRRALAAARGLAGAGDRAEVEAAILASYLALGTGDLDVAARQVEHARAVATAYGWPWAVATTWYATAQLHVMAGRTDDAMAAAATAVADAGAIGDRWLGFQAGELLAGLCERTGDYERADRLLVRAHDLGCELGLEEQAAAIETRRGTLAMLTGDLGLAESRLRAVLARAGETRLGLAEANAWHGLGMVTRRQGRLDAAEGAHRRALALVGDRGPRAEVHAGLAFVAAERGDAEAAAVQVREALAHLPAEWFPLTPPLILEASAAAALAAGDGEVAARRLGAAAALREAAGSPLVRGERRDVDRIEAGARALVGDDVVDAALDEGRGLGLDAIDGPA